MSDLLEDPDGAPYPQEVQELPWRYLNQARVVAALESVRRQALIQGAEMVADAISAERRRDPSTYGVWARVADAHYRVLLSLDPEPQIPFD